MKEAHEAFGWLRPVVPEIHYRGKYLPIKAVSSL